MPKTQIVIITGVNTGLGEAFFNYFIEKEKVKVIAISRKINDKQQALLSKQKFIHIVLDFKNLKDSKKQLDLKKFVSIQDSILFINNAATVQPIKSIGTFNDQDIINTITINTISPLIIINYIKNLMVTELKIINISSGASKNPIVGWALYCATKAANEMFVNTLTKQEEANKNIFVFNVDPGVLDSNMQLQIRATDEKDFPRLEDFKNFKKNNNLKQPKKAVLEILETCNLL